MMVRVLIIDKINTQGLNGRRKFIWKRREVEVGLPVRFQGKLSNIGRQRRMAEVKVTLLEFWKVVSY